ncbi:hypothetical protein TWF718_009125 [Orbilia javanica]|uniref:Metallo-beta-lactamase domain-containing protein n=1 Tax=Orbilia javanica TaxID=47235 RepID=A0AAN8N274_9PEZI
MATGAPPRLHVIQASYGDCFLLEYVDNGGTTRFWLIDGGPGNQGFAGSHKTTNWCLFSTLNHFPVKELERLIVTHDDRDHTYGVHALLRTVRPYAEWDVGIGRKKKKPAKSSKKPHRPWERKVIRNAEWIGGRKLVESGKFPIENIWYNDKRVVMKEYTARQPTKGWMSNVLNWFLGSHLGSEENINADWGGRCVTVENAASLGLTFDKINKVVGPYHNQLRGNYGFLEAQLRNSVQQPEEVQKKMDEEEVFDFDSMESNLKGLSS